MRLPVGIMSRTAQRKTPCAESGTHPKNDCDSISTRYEKSPLPNSRLDRNRSVHADRLLLGILGHHRKFSRGVVLSNPVAEPRTHELGSDQHASFCSRSIAINL